MWIARTGSQWRHLPDEYGKWNSVFRRYRRWLVQDSLRLNLGAAYLANGDFLETAPNAAREGDSLFAFTELVWTF